MSPAQSLSVNLLGEQKEDTTVFTRLISWATSYGRYIMIGTEIVVLVAFISRFSLDRKLTDLREEVSQKKMILEANQEFELEFRAIQAKLQQVKTLIDKQNKPRDAFAAIASLLPKDVTLLSYEHVSQSIQLELTAKTTEGFALFLRRLEKSSKFSAIDIEDVKKDPLVGIRIQLSMRTK